MGFDRDGAAQSVEGTDDSDSELAAKLAEARAKKAQIDRDSFMQRHVHNVTVAAVYVIGAMIIVGVSVWLYHYITPTNWRFLTDAQVESLQKILFSGFIGGVLGKGSTKISK